MIVPRTRTPHGPVTEAELIRALRRVRSQEPSGPPDYAWSLLIRYGSDTPDRRKVLQAHAATLSGADRVRIRRLAFGG